MRTPMVRREEKEAPQVGREELSIGAGERRRATPTRVPARPAPREGPQQPNPPQNPLAANPAGRAARSPDRDTIGRWGPISS